MEKQRPRSKTATAAANQQPETDAQLKPAATLGKKQATAEPAHPVVDLVARVRDCYRRELRLRRVTRATKDATDAALLEAVRAEIEYTSLVRAVVPPATDGDEIPRVRKLRRQIAARFRKRVQRVTRRHASRSATADNPLPGPPGEANDTAMQERKPLYIRETYFSESILPADVARPVHPEDEDDDDDEPVLQGPDLGDFEDEDDESEDDDE